MSARQSRAAKAPLPKPGQVATHLLPPLLRRLIARLGEDAAYRLCEAYGGTPLLVPSKVRPAHVDHPVLLLIGAPAFAAWVEEWGGDPITIPKLDSVLLQLRHQRVRELALEARYQGRPLASVALQTGYSLRQVHNILAAMDPMDDGQTDLFAELEAEAAAPAAATAGTPAHPEPAAHNPFGIAARS